MPGLIHCGSSRLQEICSRGWTGRSPGIVLGIIAMTSACAADAPGMDAYLFEGPVRTVVPMSFEAENLLGPRAVASAGTVIAQPMSTFGNGWSNDAQLFWRDGAVGAVLDLSVPVLADGRYEVGVCLTRAPDYGVITVEVEGEPATVEGYAAVPGSIDCYAPQVSQPECITTGTVALRAGPDRRISFMIVGRNPQSSDVFVGIDRVVLTMIRPAPSR